MNRRPSEPPALAEWFVHQTTPSGLREEVLGDLFEEFQYRHGAARWYWKQALRSIGYWMGFAWLPLLLGFALPLWLLDVLWAFLLSAIPLKEDAIRGLPLLSINLAVGCAAAAFITRARRVSPLALATASLLLLALTPARLPFTYWLLFSTLPALVSRWAHPKEESL